MPRIEAVFFDVGETIVDETREYGTWADWLDVAHAPLICSHSDPG